MTSFILAVLASIAQDAGQINADKNPLLGRSITVVGTGEASAKPDMAEISMGVVTQAATAGEALSANNAAMDRLLKLLAGSGIADKDVQTTQFSVSPQYRHEPRGQAPPTITGYNVTNQVRVKVRQMASLGKVLDQAVGEGANQVHGISFSVAEPESLLDAARRDAVGDAKRRAQLYAEAAGVKVGRVLLIQEQAPRFPQPQMMAMSARAGGGGAVPIASGEQEFRASVTVTYGIE
jgi:uncharacterized protein YggE